MYQDYVYQSIIDMLVGYHKSQLECDEYRQKVEPLLLDKWGKILKECRVNGFLMPEICFDDNKQRYLRFDQIIQKKVLSADRKYPQEQIKRI